MHGDVIMCREVIHTFFKFIIKFLGLLFSVRNQIFDFLKFTSTRKIRCFDTIFAEDY